MRALVLGISGMLGNAVYRSFSQSNLIETFGTLRSPAGAMAFAPETRERIVSGIEATDCDVLAAVLADIRPDVVVNCVGIVKQLSGSEDPLAAIPLNSVLPHRLSRLCRLVGARVIHVSTDCVFSGERGNYNEDDAPDARDAYGRSKLLGEVIEDHTITLRTSIIGHERGSAHSLVEWFLSQQDTIKGYTQARFSGLPTIELARVIRDFVVPRPDLSGLYHVAAAPISKYDLLKLVAEIYGKQIEIVPDAALRIDRSLDGGRFSAATGYRAPEWRQLIEAMHAFG